MKRFGTLTDIPKNTQEYYAVTVMEREIASINTLLEEVREENNKLKERLAVYERDHKQLELDYEKAKIDLERLKYLNDKLLDAEKKGDQGERDVTPTFSGATTTTMPRQVGSPAPSSAVSTVPATITKVIPSTQALPLNPVCSKTPSKIPTLRAPTEGGAIQKTASFPLNKCLPKAMPASGKQTKLSISRKG